jgi:uncharacterized protein YggE
MKGLVFAGFFLFVIPLALAQDIQVNRQNSTIAVTADESITADPEVAVLAIGYHNYPPTQDLAFQDNVRASEAVIKAVLAAGVDKAGIETKSCVWHASNRTRSGRLK